MIKRGDKIVIHTEDEGDVFAKCTGVTHNNIIHYIYVGENGLVAGFVGSDWVEKAEENS